MISDKFKFFWRKNGTPRLGKDCKKTELFYILWDHPTNIIFNKTTVTLVPREKNLLMNSFVFDRFLKLICPCVYIRQRNISDNDIKNSHFMYKKYNFDRVLYPFDNVV